MGGTGGSRPKRFLTQILNINQGKQKREKERRGGGGDTRSVKLNDLKCGSYRKGVSAQLSRQAVGHCNLSIKSRAFSNQRRLQERLYERLQPFNVGQGPFYKQKPAPQHTSHGKQ